MFAPLEILFLTGFDKFIERDYAQTRKVGLKMATAASRRVKQEIIKHAGEEEAKKILNEPDEDYEGKSLGEVLDEMDEREIRNMLVGIHLLCAFVLGASKKSKQEKGFLCMNHLVPAVWVRNTQFAGRHYFCSECAVKEKDFGLSQDDSFWEKV